MEAAIKCKPDNEHIPAITRHYPNVGLVLGQHRLWWPNVKPTLGQRFLGYFNAIKKLNKSRFYPQITCKTNAVSAGLDMMTDE